VAVESEGKNSVLVVDDNPVIRGVIQNILLQDNFDVSVASHGAAALEIIKNKLCDIILCDVMMPEMDGYQFFQNVRSTEKFGLVPFIFLTALDSVPEITRGWRLGCDAYLTKPFNAEVLLSTVRGKVVRAKVLQDKLDNQREKFRKRVLNTVSHEFRTPLVAISTGSEMLLSKLDLGSLAMPPDFDRQEVEKAKKLIEAIYRGGQRLERLVSDFMMLQQIEIGVAGSFQIKNCAPCSVKNIVECAQESSKKIASENDVRIEINGDIAEVKIKVAEAQMTEALVRLIENGIKFSLKPNLVQIKVEADGTEVRISVIDSGPGFDPIKLKDSIGAFSQLDRDINEQQGGGLGLAIANRLSELNGGFLSYGLAPLAGGMVTIHLPVYHCPKS
jgi:DNA-binding response OmpR family regulator/anti-sigma regulatory factor (Ser/Thr protein kinase)